MNNSPYAVHRLVSIPSPMSLNLQSRSVFTVGDQVLVDTKNRAYIIAVIPASEDDDNTSLSSSSDEDDNDDNEQQQLQTPQIRFNIKYIVGGHIENNVTYEQLMFSATNQNCQLRSGTNRSSSSTNPAPASNQQSSPSNTNQNNQNP